MKIIKTLIVFFIAVLAFFVALVIYFAKFDNQSNFGIVIKEKVIEYPRIVELINLNEPGDARYSYLAKDGPINASIYYLVDTKPSTDIKEWIGDLTLLTTGRGVSVEKSRLNTNLSDDFYSKDGLNNIRMAVRENNSDSDLNIVYLTRYEPNPGLIGITIHRDTIFVFKDALDSLNRNQKIIERLELSTIMHEWAHLLGLEHTTDDNCIMYGRIDVSEKRDASLSSVPAEYCKSTLEQIEEVRGWN